MGPSRSFLDTRHPSRNLLNLQETKQNMILFLCDIRPLFPLWLSRVLLSNHLPVSFRQEKLPLVSPALSAYIVRNVRILRKVWHLKHPFISLWKSLPDKLSPSCSGSSPVPSSLCAGSLGHSPGGRWPLVSAGVGSFCLRTQFWWVEGLLSTLPWSQRPALSPAKLTCRRLFNADKIGPVASCLSLHYYYYCCCCFYSRGVDSITV